MPRKVLSKENEDSSPDFRKVSDTECQMANCEDFRCSNDDENASKNICHETVIMDPVQKNDRVTKWDFFAITFSFVTYLVDVGLDVNVACEFYVEQKMVYFWWTVVFIALPSLIVTLFSLRWYVLDALKKKTPAVCCNKQWILRVSVLVLQMGPILRYIDSFRSAVKSIRNNAAPNKEHYYRQMRYENADVSMLRLFESLMEAAPQLILQMYIFLQNKDIGTQPLTNREIWQLVSMFFSLISISCGLAFYQRALRFSLENKVNMTWPATIFRAVWHFFDVSSRILALGLFTSLFPRYTAIICSVHCIIAVRWILTMKTDFCYNKCEEFLYNFVLAVMYIISFLNPKDGTTFKRYLVYYMCMFLENTTLMIVWFVYCPPEMPYKLPAMMSHFLCFFVGIFFMVLYYQHFHPTQNIEVRAHIKPVVAVFNHILHKFKLKSSSHTP